MCVSLTHKITFMPNNGQYPHGVNEQKNTQDQQNPAGQKKNQEQTGRLTANEAFWRSRREMYAGSEQEEGEQEKRSRD
jgi:hypothetical protein